MRNTYTLLDFGNFIESTTNEKDSPYVQLLPLTNVAAARADFISVRLNGQDTTADPSKSLLPAGQGQSSPESAKEKKQHYEEKVISRWPYILLGCLVFVALCIGLIIWKCCCRRKSKKSKTTGLLPAQNSNYAQLNEPNASTVSLHQMGGSHKHGY